MKEAIITKKAPEAIGSYSQAIKTPHAIYFSGQIPLDPATMTLVQGGIQAQIPRVFENLKAVAEAAGGTLGTIVKLTVYLTDIAYLSLVNQIMPNYFNSPYPARTSIVVVALPKEALIEIEAIMVLS